MGLLGRILKRRVDRRRGVLSEDPEDPGEAPLRVEVPPPTAGTRPLSRPDSTPSMRPREVGGTAGTARHRFPGGTPSTERLHNPSRHGR